MRYNTGNPVEPDGSSDPRDLYDTAAIADLLVNGDAAEVLSRLGVPLKSWRGLMQQVADFLIAQGYESDYLTYGAGIVVQRQTQLVQRAGELYRVLNASDIPLTLTGTWATDSPKLLAVGDAALRQALAVVAGAGMIGFSEGGTYGAGTVGAALKSLSDAIAEALEEVADAIAQIDAIQNFPIPRNGNLQTTIKPAIQSLGSVGRSGVFATPAEFTSRAGVKIYYRKDNSGQASLITRLDRFKPAGAFCSAGTEGAQGLKAYYVKPGGNNASAGTTWATALASVATALAKTDVDVVFVAPGNYLNGNHLGTYAGTRSVSVQAVGGIANFISGPVSNLGNWTATGTAGIYKQAMADATIAGIVALDFQDSAGNPLTLLPVASVAAVVASPGSWYRDAGTTELFASLPDLSAPVTGSVLYYQAAPMRVTAPGVKFHHSDINYIGGNAGAFSARLGSLTTIIYGERIGCCGQSAGDGWQIKDVGLSIAVACRASRNFNDGFNYHALSGIDPHFVEIDCIGSENFAIGTGNGSTSHEAVKGFRINCHYYGNYGPGVADVNDAQTFNVGCTSRSNGPTGNANAGGFQVSGQDKSGAGARMWLDGCVADANAGGDFMSTLTGRMLYRDIWSGRDVVSVDGTSSAMPFTS